MAVDPAVTVRAAEASEARACRIMLPAMFSAGQSPDLLVALVDDGNRPRLAGALGLSSVQAPGDGGFSTLLAVAPPFRRRGVGRALLAAAAARCAGRTTVLRALLPTEPGSLTASFLGACGFDGCDTVLHFETDGVAFHAEMARIRARLEAAGRIPAGARVVRLRDVPAPSVAALVSRHLPSSPRQLLRRLHPGAEDAVALDLSVAVMLDDRLCGVMVYSWNDGLPAIEAWVVDPAVRSGWVTVLTLEAATWNGLQEATRTGQASRVFRFSADTRVRDTVGLARRAGIQPYRTELFFWRRVCPA